jgi:hypothetical protein
MLFLTALVVLALNYHPSGCLRALTDRLNSKPYNLLTEAFSPMPTLADFTQQHLFGEGLFQNSPDPEFGRTSFERRIDSCRNHDRRHIAAALSQFEHEFETVQTRHVVVDDQAGDVGIVPEEIGATLICPDAEAIYLEEKACRIRNELRSLLLPRCCLSGSGFECSIVAFSRWYCGNARKSTRPAEQRAAKGVPFKLAGPWTS